MAAKRDYYDILGVSRQADDAQIKRAYRRLVKKYHPDINPGAEEQFKEITEAYEILSDGEKRKLYDRFGNAAFDGTGGAQDFYQKQGTDGGYRQFHFDGNMEDLFGDFFGGFHDFGGDRQRRHGSRSGSGYGAFGGYGGMQPRKGRDVTRKIDLTFDEAVFGCEKTMRFSGADGRVQSLRVRIPAGIDTGKKIRIAGKGEAGSNGGEPGSLLLEAVVGTKAGYERRGTDVYTTVRIPFTTAALGGEILVPTLYGSVSCRVREGTQGGSRLRLKGKGIVSMNDPAQKGDQYTTVEIQVPRELSREAKERLREFRAAVQSVNSAP